MPTRPTKPYSGLYNQPIHQSEWPNKARTVSESLVIYLFGIMATPLTHRDRKTTLGLKTAHSPGVF